MFCRRHMAALVLMGYNAKLFKIKVRDEACILHNKFHNNMSFSTEWCPDLQEMYPGGRSCLANKELIQKIQHTQQTTIRHHN